MRLLVTGAAGFLGRNALLALPEQWEIVATHRPGDATLGAFVARHRLRHVRLVGCDLANEEQARALAREGGAQFDGCLYLASNTVIPASITRPVEDLTSNTITLLRTLEQIQCEHLVYLSSGAVYMGLSGLVGPGSPLAPTLPYAVSKLASEQYIRAFATQRGTPGRATIVRFFGAFGPYEPPRKLYTRLVRQFAFARDPRFRVTGDGENYIDAMYVDDAMRALLAAFANPPAPAQIRTVDLGVGAGESVRAVVTRAARTFGLEAEIMCEGVSPEYITFRPDPAPFAALYGVTPTVSLEVGLHRLAAHLAPACQEALSE